MGRIIKLLFVFVLVCKIFSFDYDSESTQKEIDKWIKDKKVVSQTQTTTPSAIFGDVGRTVTYITIIADTIKGE